MIDPKLLIVFHSSSPVDATMRTVSPMSKPATLLTCKMTEPAVLSAVSSAVSCSVVEVVAVVVVKSLQSNGGDVAVFSGNCPSVQTGSVEGS